MQLDKTARTLNTENVIFGTDLAVHVADSNHDSLLRGAKRPRLLFERSPAIFSNFGVGRLASSSKWLTVRGPKVEKQDGKTDPGVYSVGIPREEKLGLQGPDRRQ